MYPKKGTYVTLYRFRVNIFVTLMIVIMSASVFSVSADRIFINEYDYGEVAPEASRLYYKYEESTEIRHFVYLEGEDVELEPNGQNYTGSHVFKYAQGSNSSLAITLSENITDKLVYPYQYNFEIDSLGQIHTVFVADNYTLYYAVRSPSGSWTVTNVTQPSLWLAWAPTIALGEDEQPRIVYVVSYREDADAYWGNIQEVLVSVRTVHYSVLDNGNWLHYDIIDNHGLFPDDASKVNPYYPGILIANGTTFVVYNNNVQLAAESRLQYIHFPEIPDANGTEPDYRTQTHRYAAVGTGIAVVFSRPYIELMGETGVVIVAGSYRTGGGIISYNNDRFETPDPDRSINRAQWEAEAVEPSINSKETKSISIIKDDENSIYVVYSAYDLFDAGGNRFRENVFFKSFSFIIDPDLFDDIDGEGLIPGGLTRATNINQIHHTFPVIDRTEIGYEVAYFKYRPGQTAVLSLSSFGEPVSQADNSFTAFFALMGVLAGVLTLSVFAIRMIPQPKVEEEVMPHMINLREAITED